jgi:ketosteroid isomerase-like protein
MQFDRMQAAVEEKRTDDFLEAVSPDFAGKNGMDRAALHNLLRLQVLGNASIGVTRGPLDIRLQGDHATVECSVLLTGGGGRFLPERAQTYTITSGWREEDGQWRVYYADWSAE